MDLLSAIQLPHWLMIVGAIFVATGFFGLAFTRNKQGSPASLPGDRRAAKPKKAAL